MPRHDERYYSSNRDRHEPKRHSDRSEADESWRHTRIKEEPISEDEGRRNYNKNYNNSRTSSSSRHESSEKYSSSNKYRDREEDRRGDRDRSRTNVNRDRRSRSRSPRGRDRRRNSTSPQSSRFRQPLPPQHHREDNRERRPRHHQDQDRDRDRHRNNNDHHSPPYPPPPSSSSSERQAREADWDNFFNPNSSTQIKREKVEDEASKYGKKSGSGSEDGGDKVNKEKEKPNFGLSGKLTEETNTFRGVVIKYSEPPEARKPQKIRWRLYPFKGNETLPTMFIHRQSAYLLGRDRKIADIPIDHPSCSKQHAVIQYRLMAYERADGSKGRRIKPYVIDLESGNGTFVNGKQIEAKRYVELFEKDVLKFGFSSREYVLLHEHSKDEPDDDEPLGNSPEIDDKARIKIEKMEQEELTS